MTQIKIQYRDPRHLKGRYTPALKQIPELPQDSSEFLALAAGLKKAGFIRPILVDENEQVIDDHSRSLLVAALRWGKDIPEVPVQVCCSADAPIIRIHSLAHVRHLSKSAIAYLAVPDLQPALDAARLQKLENLRKGQQTPEGSSGAFEAKTIEELAEELGICRETLKRAIEVRKAFEDKKKYSFNVKGGERDGATVECTFQEWFEPKLLQSFIGGEHEDNRPLGLGGILAGIEAKKLNPEKFNPKKNSAQMELKLWEESFQPLNRVAPSWGKLSEEDRVSVLKHWERTVRKMPDDLRDAMAEILEKSDRA